MSRAVVITVLLAGFLASSGCGKSEFEKKKEELDTAVAALKEATDKLEADTKAQDTEKGITSRKLIKKWVVIQGTRKMDGTKFAQVISATTGKPELVIRCEGKKTDLFISTDTVVDDHNVRLKLDEAKPLTQQWDRSDDYEALFSRQPVALAKQFVVAKVLMFEYKPYREGPKVVEFQLDGLKDALSEASSVCTWAK